MWQKAIVLQSGMTSVIGRTLWVDGDTLDTVTKAYVEDLDGSRCVVVIPPRLIARTNIISHNGDLFSYPIDALELLAEFADDVTFVPEQQFLSESHERLHHNDD